jgi:hypothetical protein
MSTVRKVVARKDGGADVGPQERINFIEGANMTLTVAEDAANKEIDVTIAGSAGNITVRKNSGADVGTRARLNFIEGANVTLTVTDDAVDGEVDITIASGAGVASHASTHEPGGADEVNDIDIAGSGTDVSAHKSRHVSGGADPFAGGDLLDATARVSVSKNSGADVGARRTLNFIEGANITLTIADDAGGEEVDITITSSGGGGGGDLSQWYPAVQPNSTKGDHPTVQMVDAQETTVYQSFVVPYAITSIVEAYVVVIPDGTGNLDWQCTTDFGTIAAGEQYNASSDSTTGTTAVTNGEIEGINISAALTGAAAKDLVGITFMRDGNDAADTVNAAVHYLGIWIRGT